MFRVVERFVSCWLLVVANALNHSNGINVIAKRIRLFLCMSQGLVIPMTTDFAGPACFVPGLSVSPFRNRKPDSAMQGETRRAHGWVTSEVCEQIEVWWANQGCEKRLLNRSLTSVRR